MYCKDGRIFGAEQKGVMWLIPEESEKPIDSRKVRKNERKKKTDE